MDISQESDPKSQDEIPVFSSYGKDLEWYVRERYFKKNVCGWRISSDHTEQEVLLTMFSCYRRLVLAFLFSFGDKLLHK